LWADGADASTTTRWMTETATIGEAPAAPDVGSVRVDTPRGVAVVGTDAVGTTVDAPIDGGRGHVTAVGLTVDEVVAAVVALRVADGRVVAQEVPVPAGMHLVGRSGAGEEPAWSASVRSAARSAPAGAGADALRWVAVEAGPQMTLYQQTSEWFQLTASTPVTVDGRPAFLGTDARGARAVTFGRDGVHVVVTGHGVGDAALLAYAASLHTASDQQWEQLTRSTRGPPAATAGRSPVLSLHGVRSGSLRHPLAWTAR
jgi:hypothetical protein